MVFWGEVGELGCPCEEDEMLPETVEARVADVGLRFGITAAAPKYGCG